jgi:peptidoglycan/xylan/chitin deacetylase (PgdA/CDA1 family)/GT2 family glycosyltransferase
MNGSPVRLSVIIPTRDRRELLLRCLAALREQTQDPDTFEVVVVDDHARDGSAEAVAALEVPFGLRVVQMTDETGIAAARNAGIDSARGDLCIFLDDDLIPDPALVAEHAAAHAREERIYAIGRVTHVPPPRGDWYERAFAEVFNEHFDGLEARPLTWTAVWQNLSVTRADLLSVGGLDSTLPINVDIELGFRLSRSGMEARYLPRAHAVQDDRKTRADRLAAEWRQGASCIELSRRHPEVLPVLLGSFEDVPPRQLVLRRALIALRVPARLLARAGALIPGRGRQKIWFRFVSRYAFWAGARRSMSREMWTRITRGVPVLLYHGFSAARSPDRYVVSKRAFARQMTALRVLGYRPIAFEELARALHEGRPPPRRAVALTMDDGYRDNLEIAHPVLVRRGIPATIFLVTGRIGGRAEWEEDPARAGRVLLSQEEIAQLRADGVSFGAHTRTHPSLPDSTDEEIAAEVEGSRQDLEALGIPGPTFAYPYGRFDDRAVAAVGAAGFEGAGSTEPRRARLDDDPLLVPRIEIRGGDSLLTFVRKLWFGGA